MILAINTSTPQFSLALLDGDGTLLTEQIMSGGKGHFKALMPALDFMLQSNGFKIDEVRCIGVATGPGSFTGLRVGIALAKGLCHALELPLVGISSLEAMANQIPWADLPLVPVLTSRRGEAFTTLFRRGPRGELVRSGVDMSIKFEDFPSCFTEPAMFVGNDYRDQAPRIKDLLGPSALLAPAFLWNLKASSIGSLALKRFASGDLDDPYQLTPVYLRPPDIRPNPYLPIS
ncbi:MAG: tRNA (adenosine(37)-N6)-threonylcarbamoyltransferase complex dimerization subunit type 1 TsaB [Deltaproteobacteria bacterium]|nr:tRNA (adenosine(37)-N6)-threonylcarbamoyltransferase complex dimerization subunit type 1 TsaB [Deltaproteobacteria bacterium]MBW2050352.1 tRNA (adenosine(37)-N6)-threonylcarbamoyltransferase complex dimerization subunit type 1 TsaB [Deltaproteobacteria bacterium]MBW2110336.1 tRNA (adenosine(37)-N6)-threonylcarbamoyltransferase complex dimerization subunit type 1 TsaB [Deltaproteobacteria bacterium]HDZ91829.1 tRNA (adenosine(37)-N6)-threonylcarbamoyltransferase complex dimerization subunit typ